MALTVVDANILLYAWNRAAPEHDKAKRWLERTLSEEWLGLPWVTIWAFLRLITNQRVFPHPMAATAAHDVVDGWLKLPNVAVLDPGPRHAQILRGLVIGGQATGPLLSDAVLAALTIEHGGSLATTDRDFSRFEGLSWFNPIAAA